MTSNLLSVKVPTHKWPSAIEYSMSNASKQLINFINNCVDIIAYSSLYPKKFIRVQP